jgi:hypothetical protein
MPIGPNTIVVTILLDHIVGEVNFLLIVLELINNPYSMTPGMIIFRLNLEYFIDKFILLFVGLFMLAKKAAVLP